MKKICFSSILMFALMISAFAQHSPFAGRWDMTLQPKTGAPYPQWLEVTEKDGALGGRYQPRGGAARPILAAKTDADHLILTLTEANPRGPATTWDLTVSGDNLSGVEKRGDTAGPQDSRARAPSLKRPMPKAWTAAKAIFNGKDLTGWEPIGTAQNKWVARNGELV